MRRTICIQNGNFVVAGILGCADSSVDKNKTQLSEIGLFKMSAEQETKSHNINCTIMGRKIGTASGCDYDFLEITFHDFIPVISGLPSGDVTINFLTGTLASYDGTGRVLECVDILTAFSANAAG
jgi:hypothetical protein